MRKQTVTMTMLALWTLVAGAAAFAADRATAKGEVIEIQHGASVQNQGEFDRITIRDRNGETRRLLLGPSESCPDCVRVGDRVRARVMAGEEAATTQRVRTMKVRRTGETLAFRNEAGELIRDRSRVRSQDGSCSGVAAGSQSQRHERAHQPGTGGGGGSGARHGGGRR